MPVLILFEDELVDLVMANIILCSILWHAQIQQVGLRRKVVKISVSYSEILWRMHL